jgi:hypothetical protein
MNVPRWLPRLRRRGECCPECGTVGQETYCDVCGYDLVQRIRADTAYQAPPRL